MSENVYPPPSDFSARANVPTLDAYRALCQNAKDDPEHFWGDLAEKELFWFEKWNHVFEWNPPFVKWFAGGKTNASTTPANLSQVDQCPLQHAARRYAGYTVRLTTLAFLAGPSTQSESRR